MTIVWHRERGVSAADELRLATTPRTHRFTQMWAAWRVLHEDLGLEGDRARTRLMIWHAAALRAIVDADRFQDDIERGEAREKLVVGRSDTLRPSISRMGHEVVEVYEDFGISGGRGRDKRPAFDRLHHDAARRKFDIVMAWSVDRLGRSLQDLVAFLEHIRACDIGLFLHQQGLDTTTPSGRAMFGMLGVFAEFERSIIRERVKSGMARARAKGTRSGKAIGRPALDPSRREAIRQSRLVEKLSLRDAAARFGVSTETVRRCAVHDGAD